MILKSLFVFRSPAARWYPIFDSKPILLPLTCSQRELDFLGSWCRAAVCPSASPFIRGKQPLFHRSSLLLSLMVPFSFSLTCAVPDASWCFHPATNCLSRNLSYFTIARRISIPFPVSTPETVRRAKRIKVAEVINIHLLVLVYLSLNTLVQYGTHTPTSTSAR